jgi:hypothetical protein
VASALHFSPSLTMRALLALLVLASAASTALANPVSLSASDVTTALQPFSDKIEHCYLDHTANVYGLGKLSVELSVSRKGALETIAIKAPGLDTAVGVKVASCIVDTLDGISFPARRTHTTATVPYFFQRTADVGPFESCWKAEGCSTHKTTAKAKRTRDARSGLRLARHNSASRSRHASSN